MRVGLCRRVVVVAIVEGIGQGGWKSVRNKRSNYCSTESLFVRGGGG